MTCLRDMLVYYNNADVSPFLEAIAKQRAFYEGKGLDLFKDGISVPGLSLRLLFTGIKKSRHFFQLFGEKNQDLHRAVKEGIVGGPSIVFCRRQVAGETLIRSIDWLGNTNPEAKLCRGVAGYDANALYLWCTAQKMPTGILVRRRREHDFKADWGSVTSKAALDWLRYEAATRKTHIHTWVDQGGERRFGPNNRPVDGYAEASDTIFEFHGCYFHGHGGECLSTKKPGAYIDFQFSRFSLDRPE